MKKVFQNKFLSSLGVIACIALVSCGGEKGKDADALKKRAEKCGLFKDLKDEKEKDMLVKGLADIENVGGLSEEEFKQRGQEIRNRIIAARAGSGATSGNSGNSGKNGNSGNPGKTVKAGETGTPETSGNAGQGGEGEQDNPEKEVSVEFIEGGVKVGEDEIKFKNLAEVEKFVKETVADNKITLIGTIPEVFLLVEKGKAYFGGAKGGFDIEDEQNLMTLLTWVADLRKNETFRNIVFKGYVAVSKDGFCLCGVNLTSVTIGLLTLIKDNVASFGLTEVDAKKFIIWQNGDGEQATVTINGFATELKWSDFVSDEKSLKDDWDNIFKIDDRKVLTINVTNKKYSIDGGGDVNFVEDVNAFVKFVGAVADGSNRVATATADTSLNVVFDAKGAKINDTPLGSDDLTDNEGAKFGELLKALANLQNLALTDIITVKPISLDVAQAGLTLGGGANVVEGGFAKSLKCWQIINQYRSLFKFGTVTLGGDGGKLQIAEGGTVQATYENTVISIGDLVTDIAVKNIKKSGTAPANWSQVTVADTWEIFQK